MLFQSLRRDSLDSYVNEANAAREEVEFQSLRRDSLDSYDTICHCRPLISLVSIAQAR